MQYGFRISKEQLSCSTSIQIYLDGLSLDLSLCRREWSLESKSLLSLANWSLDGSFPKTSLSLRLWSSAGLLLSQSDDLETLYVFWYSPRSLNLAPFSSAPYPCCLVKSCGLWDPLWGSCRESREDEVCWLETLSLNDETASGCRNWWSWWDAPGTRWSLGPWRPWPSCRSPGWSNPAGGIPGFPGRLQKSNGGGGKWGELGSLWGWNGSGGLILKSPLGGGICILGLGGGPFEKGNWGGGPVKGGNGEGGPCEKAMSPLPGGGRSPCQFGGTCVVKKRAY